MPYRPKDAEPGGWRPDAPRLRVHFHEKKQGAEQDVGREVARVRVWGTKQSTVVYMRNADGTFPQTEQREGSTTSGYAVEPVSSVGFDVDSSMGPLFWTRRTLHVGAEPSGEEPTERFLLLDGYDRIVAAEVLVEGTPTALELRVYGDFPKRFVEEVVTSYGVVYMQIHRINEYQWSEEVKYM